MLPNVRHILLQVATYVCNLSDKTVPVQAYNEMFYSEITGIIPLLETPRRNLKRIE